MPSPPWVNSVQSAAREIEPGPAMVQSARLARVPSNSIV
jgi:hypothetical protein